MLVVAAVTTVVTGRTPRAQTPAEATEPRLSDMLEAARAEREAAELRSNMLAQAEARAAVDYLLGARGAAAARRPQRQRHRDNNHAVGTAGAWRNQLVASAEPSSCAKPSTS